MSPTPVIGGAAADPTRPRARVGRAGVAGRAAWPAGLLVGVLADALFADPRRAHPVALFGAAAARLERALWRPRRRAGLVHLAVSVLPPVWAGAALDRRLASRPWLRTGYVALLTWLVLGARSLRQEAVAVEAALAGDRLAQARSRLAALCGRDAAALDPTGVRRAVLESVAENTSDAAVAPLWWGALAGPAGLLGYRAVNTLDAMVGHHSARYERFGWPAARLDDLLNLAPARLTGLLAAALAPSVGGSRAAALAAWRLGARAHPSPNAGVCEAAFAGALGVRLGGPVVYPYGRSVRPWLGAGAAPGAGEVARAVALSQRVVTAAALLGALTAALSVPAALR